MSDQFDLIVIGAGPGGYVAAIRASQLGMKTALIEKRATLGGTCLNVGCIPSKALLDSSAKYHLVKEELGVHGIETKNVSLNLATMMQRKQQVVDEVCSGVEFLMKKNKIKVYHGEASFIDKKTVSIQSENSKKEQITAPKILVATGSAPVEIPGLEFDKKNIISSDQAIALEKVPEKMAIIGAGVIGLELGSVYSRLGAKVQVIELLPQILPGIDKQTASAMQRSLQQQGLEFYLNHKVQSAKTNDKGVAISAIDEKEQEVTFEADIVLVAVGRKPYTENLQLEKAGIELTEKKRIKINATTFETTTAGIYAIGDVVDGPMLAHKAEEEGVAVAEVMAGQKGHVNYHAIPFIVYTEPELAWAGKTEAQLKEEGIAYNTGRSFFRANARAKAMNMTEGQVKILADKKTDRILGVSVMGPGASDLINELTLALEFGASAEDLARTVHGHPTLSEVIKDAAQSAGGWAIHG